MQFKYYPTQNPGWCSTLSSLKPKQNWFSLRKFELEAIGVFMGEHDWPNEGEDRNPPLTDVSSQDGGSWQEALSLLEQARKSLQVGRDEQVIGKHIKWENIMVHIKIQVFHSFCFWQKSSQFGTLEVAFKGTAQAQCHHRGENLKVQPPPSDPAAFWLVKIYYSIIIMNNSILTVCVFLLNVVFENT